MGGIQGEELGCRKHMWGGRNCSVAKAEPEWVRQWRVDGPAASVPALSPRPRAARRFREGSGNGAL